MKYLYATCLMNLCFLSACMSLPQYARLYFTRYETKAALEPSAVLLKRLRDTSSSRDMIWGKEMAKEMASCALLRNQVFAAALHAGAGKDAELVKQAAMRLEKAYQSDEEIFVAACKQEKLGELGQLFMRVQALYYRGS